MAHIWKSLVDDSKKTIDENLDLIITDLITQSGSRLWRSREASCLALADIIQGRKFSQVAIILAVDVLRIILVDNISLFKPPCLFNEK